MSDERLRLLIEYLKALTNIQNAGVFVRNEILETVQKIEGEIERWKN